MKSGADFIENKQFKLCLRIANLTFFTFDGLLLNCYVVLCYVEG